MKTTPTRVNPLKAAAITSACFVAALLTACSNAPAEGAANTANQTSQAASSLEAVLAHPRRDDERARDQYRHPKETLEFFEVSAGKAVAEIWPGWYTNVIAPYLAQNGGTYSAVLLPDSNGQRYVDRNKKYKEKYSNEAVYGNIEYGEFFSNVDEILAPESQDIVLSFRNVHNWMSRDFGDHAFEVFYKALKPGGILGVVEHRFPESSAQDPKALSGYVQESYMKDMAKRAGFEFVGSSEVNANPKDDADHPLGVWTLPPRLRAPEAGSDAAQGYDAQTYLDIGESDRATLKFRKPL